jgi:hypothetical protein
MKDLVGLPLLNVSRGKTQVYFFWIFQIFSWENLGLVDKLIGIWYKLIAVS